MSPAPTAAQLLQGRWLKAPASSGEPRLARVAHRSAPADGYDAGRARSAGQGRRHDGGRTEGGGRHRHLQRRARCMWPRAARRIRSRSPRAARARAGSCSSAGTARSRSRAPANAIDIAQLSRTLAGTRSIIRLAPFGRPQERPRGLPIAWPGQDVRAQRDRSNPSQLSTARPARGRPRRIRAPSADQTARAPWRGRRRG